MIKIPKITLEENLEEEVDQIIKALHHERYTWLREQIFKVLPGMKKTEGKEGEEEKIEVEKFVQEFKKNNEEKIGKILASSKHLLENKSKMALQELSSLMDYEWPNNHSGYKIIPMITPHSPFKNNKMYITILGQIYNSPESQNMLFVAIHEISHFIFFDILKKNENLLGKHEGFVISYLKEILAPVLMNQEKLASIIDVHNYYGNPDLHHVYIKTKKGKRQICEYFRKIYENMKYEENKDFVIICTEMFHLVNKIKPELKKRFDMWNKYGYEVEKNLSVLAEYETVIEI